MPSSLFQASIILRNKIFYNNINIKIYFTNLVVRKNYILLNRLLISLFHNVNNIVNGICLLVKDEYISYVHKGQFVNISRFQSNLSMLIISLNGDKVYPQNVFTNLYEY